LRRSRFSTILGGSCCPSVAQGRGVERDFREILIEQVHVGSEGEARVGVAYELLHLDRVPTRPEERRRARVPEA
jgi:hypothetical protein